MKKKHDIRRLLSKLTAIFLITLSSAAAADKVVVIPLDSGSGDTGRVRTVTSATGRIWIDRNLGAHRAAIKSDDPLAYGALYQWGRLGDGHEYRESPTTSSRSPDDVPGHNYFITGLSDWRVTQKDSLWQGASGINNPCPAGFRLPTETEWETERASWSSNDAVGAFASALKLVEAGYRLISDGTVYRVGSRGYYWSSTVDGSFTRNLSVNIDHAYMGTSSRANGMSVRCIKD